MARVAGALIGIGLAVALVVGSRPEARVIEPSASARFTFAPSGELELLPSPPAAVLATDSLAPGVAPSVAGFEVRNQTGSRLDVGFRARPSSTAMDGMVRVRLTGAGETFADTTLQGLRDGGGSTFTLGPGMTRRLRLEAWIPPDVTTGFDAQSVDVTLSAVARPVEDGA